MSDGEYIGEIDFDIGEIQALGAAAMALITTANPRELLNERTQALQSALMKIMIMLETSSPN